MTASDLTVFIVDDDASVRDALALSLSVRGYRTAVFANAKDFLSTWHPDRTGCLLLDIRMPDMDGLSLQQHLTDLGSTLPVIIITGHGDVESVRTAFKARAIDYLEKPLKAERLISAIDDAFKVQAAAQALSAERESAARLLSQLTPREHEVRNLVVAGFPNREIASKLSISVRTVEVHKAHLMSKLGAESVADLVRLSIKGNLP